jgi:hypothetical protein
VAGSMEMFLDEFFENEENSKIIDFFIKFFLTNEVEFEFTKEDAEPIEYHKVPDIAEIADNLKSCFHVNDDLFRKENNCPEISRACLKQICLDMISMLFLRLLICSKIWR